MSLVLEIEFLSGTCFAATGPDSDLPDWPPQPDRVFSALVSTWGAHGENQEEAKALEWLETQALPIIEASGHQCRTAPVSYVPPNDPESGRGGNLSVLPALRRKQPRRFPAARPTTPIIRFHWKSPKPSEPIFAALVSLARDTAYIGHSTSLTRCHFTHVETEATPEITTAPKRKIYPGRFAELRSTFAAGRRPLPGMPVSGQSEIVDTIPSSRFSDRWMILEHLDGEMPDIRGASLVAKTLRDALLSGFQRIGLGDRIPEEVSGHAADGQPTRKPHLAVLPLPFSGFPHADGHVMGYALVPPRDSALFEDDAFKAAMRGLAPMDAHLGRRVLTLRPRSGTGPQAAFSIRLVPTFEPSPGKRSLQPGLYCLPSRSFATVTPIVLDRHLKNSGEERTEELQELLLVACRHAGLPEPQEIQPDKHSALEGTPSAWPSGNAPPWMRWRLPPSLGNRPLIHACLRFAEPVQGPILLGAGRFLGLGLLRPLERLVGSV